MGLFMTLEGLTEEDAVRLASEEAVPADRLRVFDLHCDTLDRLAFHGDASVPGGFAARDARIPAHRMATSRQRCLCLACAYGRVRLVPVLRGVHPDEVRGDEAWALFRRVQSVLERELERCGDKLAQARTMAEVDAALAAGKTAAVLTVEGASFLEDDGQAEGRLDALADAGVRMVTLTWNGPNALGSGNDTSHGLTGFGRSCVGELECRGIVVTCRTSTTRGSRMCAQRRGRFFAASHSNARRVRASAQPGRLALRELARLRRHRGLNFCTQFRPIAWPI
ncbi:MAG: membrane dipeptidase [Eggerthellaceae bacterium]